MQEASAISLKALALRAPTRGGLGRRRIAEEREPSHRRFDPWASEARTSVCGLRLLSRNVSARNARGIDPGRRLICRSGTGPAGPRLRAQRTGCTQSKPTGTFELDSAYEVLAISRSRPTRAGYPEQNKAKSSEEPPRVAAFREAPKTPTGLISTPFGVRASGGIPSGGGPAWLLLGEAVRGSPRRRGSSRFGCPLCLAAGDV